MRLSHETIYRSLFIQARGVLKKELMDHLRSKRRMRRSRHSSEHGHSRGQIVDAISIRERPAEAEDRAIPGHWEGDLLAGGKNSYIATLVERHSRFLMLIKVPSKDTAVVVAALSKHVRKFPATLRRSLTWDRELEMAKHKDFTVATDVQVSQAEQFEKFMTSVDQGQPIPEVDPTELRRFQERMVEFPRDLRPGTAIGLSALAPEMSSTEVGPLWLRHAFLGFLANQGLLAEWQRAQS